MRVSQYPYNNYPFLPTKH